MATPGLAGASEEFDALGMSFADRAARCNEYIGVMKALWTQSPASYSGDTVSFENVHFNPKPVQSPHPPIFVGGESKPALRRVATFGDGWYGFNLTPDEFADGLVRLDEHLDAAGRSRDEITKFVSPGRQRPTPEMIEQYAAAGADQVICTLGARNLEQLDERIERLRAATGLAA